MLVSASMVLAEPGWADLFSPSSLAEVPVAATIGGRALAGTIDRLLVDEERVLIVDFKTSRRPPEDLSGVPRQILRQMAAYSAALEKVYPGRRIEAALLYTAAPRLIIIPHEVIEENKQALMAL